MNNETAAIVNNFYEAFKQKNAAIMVSNYHPDLRFQDPAFGALSYQQTCAMWSMLCAQAADLDIVFTILKVDNDEVQTKWIAEYTFSKTNRFIHNEIIATMTIKDGRIISHVDDFDLHKWARQALGFKGLLLGGTSFFKTKLQQQTGRQLARYMQKK